MDWVPRSVRSRAREIENAYIGLENELKRVPDRQEVAEHMGVTIKEFHDILTKLSLHLGRLLRGAVGRRRPRRRPERDRHDQGRERRGPGRHLRDRGDQGDPRRGDRAAARAREDRDRALLLRGPDAQGDRAGPWRHRVAREPAAHQVGAASARQAARRPDRSSERRRAARSASLLHRESHLLYFSALNTHARGLRREVPSTSGRSRGKKRAEEQPNRRSLLCP